MSFSGRSGNAQFGRDYDLERFTFGERDEQNRLVWYDRYPNNNEWDRITLVTVNLNPEGEPDYRNINTGASVGRPLDPLGTYSGQRTYHDLDDAVTQIMDHYGYQYGPGPGPEPPPPPPPPPPPLPPPGPGGGIREPPRRKPPGVIRRVLRRLRHPFKRG